MLDDLNKQYDDMEYLIYENEKAHLTSIYFEASLRDGKSGLTEKEYKRFLKMLSNKTRKEFEQQGGFQYMDIDGDGIVDLDEFQKMLETVLQVINEKEEKIIKRKKSYIK